jgi:RNA polymerase sigma-70 factor, ECF subfamily
MSPELSFHLPPGLGSAVERCWRKAAPPADWNVTASEFQTCLERSVAQRFAGLLPDAFTIERYLDTLHVADLALACACRVGCAAAWDYFVARFRPELYRAARAIAGESSSRELADSLYAELYGSRDREGQRKSLLDYFHGRSKLSTWLRAVLAQRHVDEIRRAGRMEPLEELADDGRLEISREVIAATTSTSPDPERVRYMAILQAVLTAVLSALDSRERLRLAYYYVDELTLAQIGKLLGEHEATVSRQLDRTRRKVRKRIDAALRDDKKLTEEQLRLCYGYAREEWPFDLTGALSARD